MKKLTTEEFIEKSKLIWGDRFDYSLVEYINNNSKVKIICPINGVFEQQPKRHLEGRESKNKRLENKQNFIEKSNKKFNFKFDYSLVEYENNDDKVIIICPIHGKFEQKTTNHLNSKCGCGDCYKDICNTKKVLKEETTKEEKVKIKINRKELFFKRCFEIHGDKYDYSLVTKYVNSQTKVDVICKKHGVFETTPDRHTNNKNGCPECKRLGLKKFIEKSNIKHINKYDYSLVTDYFNNKQKVDIICKEHGIFNQRVSDHMIRGTGCPECKKVRFRTSVDDFIKRAQIIHNGKYVYSSDIEFKSNKDKIGINCKEHGLFTQTVNSHLCGQGCPECKESKGETEVKNYLLNNGIKFEKEKKFIDCNHKGALPFDFYLPEYNICIEYNGIQHYKPIEYFGGYERYNSQLVRDKIKNEYCLKNNIHLIIIKYDESVDDKLSILLDNHHCPKQD